jgi:L-2-hydroxyglutarate oxidase
LAAKQDVIIIGGGIVGLATALQTLRRFPSTTLTVLEKEDSLAAHQTGRNSGVIHSGIYYKPGSLKARLCVAGAAAMVQFCQQNSIPYDVCGKLIVATEQSELAGLDELFRRGTENGVPGLRMLSPEQIRELEPETGGLRAIEVPGTAITDYRIITEKYAELTTALGGVVRRGVKVIGIRAANAETVVETTKGSFSASVVINCAGLHSDRIARMAGVDLALKIVPFRGEYYTVHPREDFKLRRLIYPVPDPRFPFLGVHLTPKIHGGMEAGPNAVLALKREGYTKTSVSAADVADFVSYGGFWKMARKFWRNGMGEYYRSYSRHAFLHALQRLVPRLTLDDLQPGGAGVRAQALGRDGKLIDDFAFAHSPGMLHVCNVPSPAATASLVIAEEILSMMQSRFDIAPFRSSVSTAKVQHQ